MSPAATSRQPLHYFIHYDFDALRMEIAGSLVGGAARKAYETWRAASFIAGRRPLVIDISYITEADEDGKAVLRSWREHNARIVAASPSARAIKDSLPSAPVRRPLPRHTFFGRVASLFFRQTAGNPAFAEAATADSAGAKQKSTENTEFPLRGELESQVR